MSDLTLIVVLEQLKRLHLAFPSHAGMKNNADGTARIYHDELLGLSGQALKAAASVVIQSDNYFPKVARLREVAWDWTRRNQVRLEPQLGDPLYCNRCRSLATDRIRYRPMVDGRGCARVTTIDGAAYLMLEQIKRLLCDCASPSLYVPDEQLAERGQLVMLLERVQWRCGRPPADESRRRLNRPRELLALPRAVEPMTPVEEAASHA